MKTEAIPMHQSRSQFLRALAKIALTGCFAAMTVSCVSHKAVDYRAYEKMPMKPSSAINRAVLKSNPYTSKRAFYGNYGGSGNCGKAPLDDMDELFRRHDIVYY